MVSTLAFPSFLLFMQWWKFCIAEQTNRYKNSKNSKIQEYSIWIQSNGACHPIDVNFVKTTEDNFEQVCFAPTKRSKNTAAVDLIEFTQVSANG